MAEKPGVRTHSDPAAAARAALTTCPFCSCGCGLYLHADGGVLAGVTPSEHHPVSQGRLCARGWAAHEALAWGGRLTQPLVRRNGALEPVGWEEALARAAEGLGSAVGSGVGVLGSPRATNEESYLLARMAREALCTGNIDSVLRATYQPQVDGVLAVGGRASAQGTLADLEASEVVLLVEGNLTGTHTRVGLSILRAIKQGARLVTLGPSRTQFARLAAEHVPVVPGRERGVLVRLVAAALAARDGCGLEQLPGEAGLRASVMGQSPGEAERRVAGWFARAARASVVVAPTGAPPADAHETARALASFLALTGRLGRPGSAVLVLPARGNLRGACELGVAPDRLPGARGPYDDEVRARLRTLWGGEPNTALGLEADAMVQGVSSLLAFAEDPPSALRSSGAARAALERLRCLVVLDAFLTPTARQAHVVLPIAGFGETEGTVTTLEGRVQRVRALVPPPGSARPGWRVLADLLGRLGTRTAYVSASDVLAEVATAVPAYAAALERDDARSTWGERLELEQNGGVALGPLDAPPRTSGQAPVLACDGVLDWGSDPLVSFSPTLRRDDLSRRKLHPRGVVGVSVLDGQQLGVRPGEPLRLTSANGEAVLPAELRADLEPGVLLVPYAFRESVASVMAGGWAKEVRVARG